MSFVRPTLPEIIARTKADLESRLELTSALLRRAVATVYARVIAGAAHMLHGHIEFLGRQLFPDQSDDEYLVRQASVFGISKIAPAFAIGTVALTGTNGSVLPAGSVLIRSDAAEYLTAADATIGAGVASVSVTSVLAGADLTLVAAGTLTLQSPVAGITSVATVTASTQDGSDQETTEALRARLLERFSDPPHGGTVTDYVAWAKQVAGVTRVWVTPHGLGPGSVVVRFARDNDASPIPDAGEVAAVQAYLDGVAPANATVTAFAPTDQVVPVTVSITPDTLATRAAVTAEIADVIRREGAPSGTILLSHISTAIGTTAGITNFTLSIPAADVVSTVNQLPRLGTVTFI